MFTFRGSIKLICYDLVTIYVVELTYLGYGENYAPLECLEFAWLEVLAAHGAELAVGLVD